jgi:hypothetical protein
LEAAVDLRSVRPFEGLGDLRLGMTMKTVRALLDTDFRPIVKGGAELDSYDGLGFHLYYDQDGELEFIEAFEPCEPEYDGVRLLGDETRSVLDELTVLGHEPVEDDSGYDFPRLGFGLYVSLGRTEAVSIYRRGYYDSIERRG